MQKGNQRGKILAVERFLLENSDKDHPVSMKEILDHLEANGIPAERRSVYEDLECLRAANVDIQTTRKKTITYYYVGQRDFALAELKLLVDAVQSSRFISENKSLDLIKRLEKLGSRHQAGQLHRNVLVRGRVKSMNDSIFRNVDRISDAIDSDRQITFKYFTWNVKKEKVLRREGRIYSASPWALILENENYYLLAFEGGMMKNFRIDKMQEIQIRDAGREGKDAYEKLDMAVYTDTHFGMFAGEGQRVKLRLDNSMAGVVIDQFGKETMLIPDGEQHFTASVNVAVNIQFFGWLVGLGDKVKIVEPQSVADEMREHLRSIELLYHSSEEI